MKPVLYDSELKVMECLWERGDTPASELAPILEGQVGWNRNTTYTVIKKLVAKGFIRRTEPKFVCRALVAREEVEKAHAGELVDRLYGGSNLTFLSAFVRNQGLSRDDINGLKTLIDAMAGEDGDA